MVSQAKIRNLRRSDIPAIVKLGRAEGWITDERELDLHRRFKSALASVAADKRKVLGCITTFAHDRTAWVGNLVVEPGYRRHGLGSMLLANAIEWIERRKCETILLVSAPGIEKLYTAAGFKALMQINRWMRPAMPDLGNGDCLGDKYNLKNILRIDSLCWGDNRSRLISSLRFQRKCLMAKDHDGFLMFGYVGDELTVGPGAVIKPSASVAKELLDRLIDKAQAQTRIVLDTFSGSDSVEKILTARFFIAQTPRTLMYFGAKPKIKFSNVIALASLGSMG